jgi:hypothetical protein
MSKKGKVGEGQGGLAGSDMGASLTQSLPVWLTGFHQQLTNTAHCPLAP